MRHAIETAPRDGEVVLLEDDASGNCALARWSPEAGGWVGENGEPSEITPTHWHPVPRVQHLLQEHHESGGPFQVSPSTTRAAASEAKAFRPAASTAHVDAIETLAAPVNVKRTLQARRFATFSIIAALVGTALIGMSFRTDIAAYMKRYAGQQDGVSAGTPDGEAIAQQRQVSHKPNSARRSLAREQRAAALSDEFIKAHQIDARKLQLSERIISPDLQVAELDKALAIARFELDTHMAQRNKMGDETARLKLKMHDGSSGGLAREPVMARREADAHAAPASKQGDEAPQIKHAVESARAELRQALQQERNRAEALAQELATARSDLDAHAKLASKTVDDMAQIEQAAESTTADLRKALQQERERAEALAQDLATARRDLDAHAKLSSKTIDDVAQIEQAAESASAGLRKALQQERSRAEALARISQQRAAISTRTRNCRAKRSKTWRRSSRPQKALPWICDRTCSRSAAGPRRWHSISRQHAAKSTHTRGCRAKRPPK